ncbi:MAG TPA: SPRY domain-containing protein [Usitatibacter sp.]|nr:SPRY domain-containing protein [Usitatibacter sp.]
MRTPLAVNLESRDGGVVKDAKVINGIVEPMGEDIPPSLLKRPGVTDLGLVGRGGSQLLYAWNGMQAVIGDALMAGTVSTIVSGLSFSTLNPSDKDASVVLSNNNLAAFTASVNKSVRAIQGKSTGRWYWEFSVNNPASNAVIGVANSSALTSTFCGADANGWGVESVNGNTLHNSTETAYTTIFGANEVIGVVLDMVAGTASMYRSGALVATFVTGLTGVIFPMFSMNNNTVTANFGATAFSWPIPAGCSAMSSGTGLAPNNGGLTSWSAVQTNDNAATPRLFIHNRSQGWTTKRDGTVTAVTFGGTMGAATYNLVSLTRSGTVATATMTADVFNVGDSVTVAGASPTTYNGTVTVTAKTSGSAQQIVPLTITRSGATATATTVSGGPHGLTSGSSYTISGCSDAAYNGSVTVTVTGTSTFTYLVTTRDAPDSPATGNPAFTNATWERDNANTNNNGAGGKTVFIVNLGSAPGFSNGDLINVTGSGGASIVGGPYPVQNVTSTGFQFTVSGYSGSVFTGFTINYTHGTVPVISSITRSGSIATVTTGTAHGAGVNDLFGISGANESQYNAVSGTPIQSVPSSTTLTYSVSVSTNALPISPAAGSPVVAGPSINPTFSYTVSGSPTTPATGTITAQGNGGIVPGAAYIDGYFLVMDTTGVLWNSNADDPTTWGALNFLTVRNENGAGRGIAKSLNYVAAFKEFSTEFYYDAKNATGSPFSPVDNGFVRVGCASGDSLGRVGNSHCWISQTREGNRSVHKLDGLQVGEIATPAICRIVNADPLSTVYAYGLNLKGHPHYILTLPGSNLTLAYDFTSQYWTQWSSLTLSSSSVSVTSITLGTDGKTATVVATSHGLSDGDPVNISGAGQSAYNGIFQIQLVDANTFTIQVAGNPVSPATGTIVATGYTESYFKFTKAATLNGAIYLLHETDGNLYQMQPTLYQDNGIPINTFTRSVRLDGGDDGRKKMAKIRFVGDLVDDIAMVRFSDDDSQTHSSYRIVQLDEQPAEIRKCGAFRRRSIEFRHVGNRPLRGEALELEILK